MGLLSAPNCIHILKVKKLGKIISVILIMRVKIKKIVGAYTLASPRLQKLVLNGTVGLDLFQLQVQKITIRGISGRSSAHMKSKIVITNVRGYCSDSV